MFSTPTRSSSEDGEASGSSDFLISVLKDPARWGAPGRNGDPGPCRRSPSLTPKRLTWQKGNQLKNVPQVTERHQHQTLGGAGTGERALAYVSLGLGVGHTGQVRGPAECMSSGDPKLCWPLPLRPKLGNVSLDPMAPSATRIAEPSTFYF